MRELTNHCVNPANDALRVLVTDDPGSGGACHRYEIHGFKGGANPARQRGPGWQEAPSSVSLLFQNGPIAEAGVNGITHEVLLAIVIDRLRGFQAGPYANTYNAEALRHLEMALGELKLRTTDRMLRGVEGTHAP